MSANKSNIPKRTIYFDYLRVFSTLAVMVLHVSAQNWHVADVNGVDWQIFNFYDSIVRWGVPVFVMISGALFLDRDIPLRTIYKKYILRMAMSFVVWSAIYVLFEKGSKSDRVVMFITGHYHMWFILMIIGIYMCIPFIKPIVEHDFKMKYFIVLAIIFAFLIPEIKQLAEDFGNALVLKGIDAIYKSTNNMNMYMVLGFVCYFVLGYYLNKISLNKKQRIILYTLGVCGFLSTIVLSLIVALKTQTPCGQYYGNFTVNVLLEAVSVFTWFKYRKYDNRTINAIITNLSKYSFGAYLVHALVLEQLDLQIGLNSLSFNPIFSVISIGMFVFVVSYVISAVINQVPILKKYIV